MVDAKKKILHLSFNQDQACFACGTEKGFRIFNSFPFKDSHKRDFDAGLGIVTMLFRSNIIALVGGGSHPKYPLSKVMLWDDQQAKCVGELSFKANVRGVRFRKDKILVILEQRIYVYNFADLKLLDAVETCKNPLGLCALSIKDAAILVCPDKVTGNIRIINYDAGINIEKKAHDTPISAIIISPDGKLCATTAEKAGMIRIFATENGKLLHELRRGADKTEIKNLSFDKTGTWLACTSDKGSVHIFSTLDAYKVVNNIPISFPVINEDNPKEVKSKTSVFNFAKGIVTNFTSESSFAQFHIPDTSAIIAFGLEEKNQIIIATYEGKYYLAEFDPKSGGVCKKLLEKPLF